MAGGGSVIRGSRIGAGPSGEDERGEGAARISVSYWCVDGHETRPTFSDEVAIEVPEVWDCMRCGAPAGQDRSNPPTEQRNVPFKSHLDYVKERRTTEEGQELLDEALTALRARRSPRKK